MAELDRWHAMRREATLYPDLAIVDAHHHMWWRPPEAYQLTEVLDDLGSGHDVRATIFVECGAMYSADAPDPFKPVGETQYVGGTAAISASGLFGPRRVCAGIVGHADLCRGAAIGPVLDAHVAAGGGRFRGIRHQAQADPHLGSLARATPPAGLLGTRAFRQGFGCLDALGLSFDAWVFFTQLDEVAALADAFPDTPIILNHAGGPLGIGHYASRRKHVFAIWSHRIRMLAARPNMFVKLGGLGMTACGFGFESGDVPPPSTALAEAWRPYIEVCIEAFGTPRCMFESNFPNDKQSCSYLTLWNAFKQLASGCTDEERQQLFNGTANKVYRLGLQHMA